MKLNKVLVMMLACVICWSSGCKDDDDRPEVDAGTDTETETSVDVDSASDSEPLGELEIDTSNEESLVLAMKPEECETSSEENFAYNADCVGDTCTETECCAGAVCGDTIFGNSPDYLNHYCFPKPEGVLTEEVDGGVADGGPDGGANDGGPVDANRCACDAVEMELALDVALQEKAMVCFPGGTVASVTALKFPVYSQEYQDTLPGGQLLNADYQQFSSTSIEAEMSDLADIMQPAFSMGFALESPIDDDGDGTDDGTGIVIGLQGMLGMTTVWIMQLVIPGSQYKAAGELLTSNIRGETVQFYGTLFQGTISGSKLSNLWVHGIVWDGTLTMKNAPALCDTSGGKGCDSFEFEFNLDLYGAKTEIPAAK